MTFGEERLAELVRFFKKSLGEGAPLAAFRKSDEDMDKPDVYPGMRSYQGGRPRAFFDQMRLPPNFFPVEIFAEFHHIGQLSHGIGRLRVIGKYPGPMTRRCFKRHPGFGRLMSAVWTKAMALFRPSRLSSVFVACWLMTGCNTLDRIQNIGREPELSPVGGAIKKASYEPVTLPMPKHEPEVYQANSLWRQGARSFFKDQRARTIGDVLTVNVTITDEASLQNQTTRSRTNAENLGVGGLLGVENQFNRFLKGTVDPGSLVQLDSDVSNQGQGNVSRNEDIKLNVAAVVAQVLPNGNLVIHGRQEVRVNFEVRELYVAGVVRPEDITPDNAIAHEQIAELRIAYGGRGQLTDVQQPRYGSQVLDVILPF